ncbi:MAG: hypothetical protein HYS25_00650 [Ignavibacteriales bacterium]|nr:hypothetical protein [Ignavibacteriales bacterium]
MNTKKLLITALAVFIVAEVTNYLIHTVILSSTYALEEVAKAFRPMEEMESKMWVMWVVDLIWSFFFAFFFVKGYENKGIMEGVRFGIYIGLFVSLVTAYAQYVVYPIPYSVAFQWFLYGLIQSVLLGVVAALIYKPQPKIAES